MFANLVTLFLLSRLFRGEGSKLSSLYKFQRGQVGKDLLILLRIHDHRRTSRRSAQYFWLPLGSTAAWMKSAPSSSSAFPLWAAIFSLLFFPITNALAELPTYTGYSMPRLAVLSGKSWLAVLLASFFLAFQHVALPLFFDGAS